MQSGDHVLIDLGTAYGTIVDFFALAYLAVPVSVNPMPRGPARDRYLQTICNQIGARDVHASLGQVAGLHAHEIAPGDPDRRITVSTIHRAKGTEAQLVVLLGCEERLLPFWRALQSPDGEQLAEERRLFYVACTRARDQLILTHAATRGGRPTGGPSRFLTEAGLIDPPQALAA